MGFEGWEAKTGDYADTSITKKALPLFLIEIQNIIIIIDDCACGVSMCMIQIYYREKLACWEEDNILLRVQS